MTKQNPGPQRPDAGVTDLIARLRAFGRDCVHWGDMTPSGQQMLERILDDALERNQ